MIDGDTLDLGGVRIRLHGIDAPETKQSCRAGGKQWSCGREAARALASRIGGRSVACQERDRDHYGRVVAVCGLSGADLNGWMVAQGWAFAYRRYSHAYVAEESGARAAKRGVWRGEVVPPWDWRRGKRLGGSRATTQQESGRCTITASSKASSPRSSHITGESITAYFRERLAERARSEDDDAISTLAREAARAELINTTEAADMLGVIMIAGNETTANLIGNGLWALMRHPDQMERLREEPGRARDAINEVLRYDSPVQTDFRIAKSEAVIGGKTIRAGEGVILLTGSANRDEAAFSEPDRLDIARKGPKHAAFGHGVHQCIGAELARMETSAVIASAAARLERITLAGPQPRYRRSTVVRGLERLEVHVERRQRAAHA